MLHLETQKIYLIGPNILVASLTTLPYIQNGLDTVEHMMLRQLEDYHPDLKTASSLILASGGKRIRPTIILLIGYMLHAEHESLLTLATAIEMLHTATLVHDDLIDGSLLRRGIPTLNSKWSPAATVLTGDFLFASASEMAAKTNSVEVMRLIAKTLMTIVNGEVEQLFANRCIKTVDEYYRRIYAKTASLFETSAHTAAVISKVNQHQTEVLRKFGYEIGMAFQIVDDVLDYVGDESTVGKPVGGDLRQGLVTLPMLYYMQNNPNNPTVEEFSSGQCIQDEKDIERLVKEIAQSDAITQSQQTAIAFASRAEKYITEFPETPERSALAAIARYIIERQK